MRRIVNLLMASAGTLMVLFFTTMVPVACNSSSGENLSLDSTEGIRFSRSSFGQVAIQSKQENKMVFLLAFATYCPACKKMKKFIFSEKEVGELFNKSFINAQVDIESEEGKMVVKDYEITGTPTLLFLAPDGQVINKASGFHSKEEMIALARGLSLNGKPVCK